MSIGYQTITKAKQLHGVRKPQGHGESLSEIHDDAVDHFTSYGIGYTALWNALSTKLWSSVIALELGVV